jgi:hypothetical protein
VIENYVMRKVINFATEVVVAGHFYFSGMPSLINQQRSKKRHTELQNGSVADTKCAFASPVSRARKIKFLWVVNERRMYVCMYVCYAAIDLAVYV